MRWSRVTHKEVDERVLLSLEEILEQGPSAKDASSETDRSTVRLSPFKSDIIRSLSRLSSHGGYRPSMSRTMKLVVKCGVMRFDKKLLDTVFAHRRLVDVVKRVSRVSGLTVSHVVDYDMSILGIFSKDRVTSKPSNLYMWRWTNAALGDIQERCDIGTFTAVMELVLGEALASSTELLFPEERDMFVGELISFDKWMAHRAVDTINAINKFIDIGKVQESYVEDDIRIVECACGDIDSITVRTEPMFYDYR